MAGRYAWRNIAESIHGFLGHSGEQSFFRRCPRAVGSDISSASVPAMSRSIAITIVLVCWTTPAVAHEGQFLKPHDLPAAWAFDLGISLPLLIAGVLYVRGVRRSRVRHLHEVAAYGLGWVALVIALISPLHPLGEVLFSAHMAQHTILMLIAAPLLVVGRPVVPYLFALPLRWRQRLGIVGRSKAPARLWRIVTTPLIAWALHGVVLWVWHLPALYQFTLKSDVVHSLQHLTFLVSALIFWWAIIHGRQGRMGYGGGVVYVFTTAVHTSLLGALLAVAQTPWYPIYSERAAAWGLTTLEDQQLAGLIMWVPCGVVYLAAGLVLFFLWLQESDRRLERSSHGGAFSDLSSAIQLRDARSVRIRDE
jgi:putative membrane protein